MPFGIALALIRGNVFHDQFNERNLTDPQIQGLMKKVTVETSSELDQGYPAKRGTIVEIMSSDGKTYTQALDVARGEPEFPLGPEEVEEKFKQSASGLIEPESIQKVIQFVQTLEHRKEISTLLGYLQVRK
jgi:2-methylcitrate dehydratase PrpD